MKSYSLKTKSGEPIKTIDANDLVDAQESYSKMKNLKLNDLLSIFIVEEVTINPKK